MTNLPEPQNVIYGLSCTCHPDCGVRYVGQTSCGMQSRLLSHKWRARNPKKFSNLPVSNWIRKHGQENIVGVILEACAQDGLDACEIMWIAKLGTFTSVSGMNATTGGLVARGWNHTAESRAKITAIQTGTTHTDASKLKMSNSRRYGRTGSSKLSPEQVSSIKIELFAGERVSDIAERYGVGKNNISSIKTGTTWGYIPWPDGDGVQRFVGEHRSGLTAQDIAAIREQSESGLSYGEIAKASGGRYSRNQIGHAVRGDRYAWAA